MHRDCRGDWRPDFRPVGGLVLGAHDARAGRSAQRRSARDTCRCRPSSRICGGGWPEKSPRLIRRVIRCAHFALVGRAMVVRKRYSYLSCAAFGRSVLAGEGERVLCQWAGCRTCFAVAVIGVPPVTCATNCSQIGCRGCTGMGQAITIRHWIAIWYQFSDP